MKFAVRSSYMQSGIRNAFLAIVLMFGAMLCGCQSVSTYSTVGNEHRITITKGNLAARTALDSESRVRAFVNAVKDNRKHLGASEISKAALSFVPFGPEAFVKLPNGESHIIVAFNQAYKGTRIIDSIQYGSFLQDTGELRTIRTQLVDPVNLPKVPTASRVDREKATTLFRNYLREHGQSETFFDIDEVPVMSARLHAAGYFAQYSKRNKNGSLSRMAAIVDPKNARVHVLYDINTD